MLYGSGLTCRGWCVAPLEWCHVVHAGKNSKLLHRAESIELCSCLDCWVRSFHGMNAPGFVTEAVQGVSQASPCGLAVDGGSRYVFASQLKQGAIICSFSMQKGPGTPAVSLLNSSRTQGKPAKSGMLKMLQALAFSSIAYCSMIVSWLSSTSEGKARVAWLCEGDKLLLNTNLKAVVQSVSTTEAGMELLNLGRTCHLQLLQ